MGNFFVNPAFVISGAALIASPIIIHLINRLRFRRVRFAAMEFLLVSQQKNRRRILIEQLLLLLLRILIVLAIVLLIARLILSSTQLALLQGKASAHHLVILDDSLSMQQIIARQDGKKNEQTAFDAAREMVVKLAERAANEQGNQRFTVVLSSDPGKAIGDDFREAKATEQFVKKLRSKLKSIKCTNRKLDLQQALDVAGQSMTTDKDDEAVIKYLHVVSDFRREDFKSRSSLAQSVEDLTESEITVNFIRAIAKTGQNLAITKLSGDLHVASAGLAIGFQASITNFGTETKKNVSLDIVLDGNRIPGAVQFDKIGPGKSKTETVDITFPTAGSHELRVEIPGDALAKDNVHYLAIENLPKFNDVLIIDGGVNAESDDALFVQDALGTRKGSQITGIQTRIRHPDWLDGNSLKRFSCVYLLNVPRLAPRAIQRLENYVHSGGGLAWFVGDSVDDAAYNKDLYRLKSSKGKGGKTQNRVAGLFPVKLAQTHQPLPPLDLNSREPDMILTGKHPIFNTLAKIDTALIDSLRIRRFWPIAAGGFGARGRRWEPDDAKRNDGVTTIARLRNQQPFLFEHRLGKGRIVTWLTTAGSKWADWTELKIYPVFQLELQRYLAARRPDRQKITGQRLLDLVPAAAFKFVASVRSPDSKGRLGAMRDVQLGHIQKETPLSADGSNPSPRKTKPVEYYQLDSDRQKLDFNTNRPGVYLIRYSRQKSAGPPLERMFAFNTPVEESDLRLVPEKEVNRVFENSDGFHFYGADDTAVFKGKQPGQLARRILLILLVVLLLAEQFLAYRLSYHTDQV